MKPRPILIVLSCGMLLANLAMVGSQRQELTELRRQASDLQLRAAPATNEPSVASENFSPVITTNRPGPSLELLRLRSQVGQLERRKRELASAASENQRLQSQLANRAPNQAGKAPLPAGYIRKSEAKLEGFGSPEAALQSLLWAMQNRDVATVLKAFDPERAASLAEQVEAQGTEKFFKEADALPGVVIKQRDLKENGIIELTVQIVPEDDSTIGHLPFKQIDGQWRMMSGF